MKNNVNDKPTSEDLLGYKEYAKIISDRINTTCNNSSPLTIGVYGKWGTGKTSFLKMIEKELNTHSIKPVWFRAWKYNSEEYMWWALIQTIFIHLKSELNIFNRLRVKIKFQIRNNLILKNSKVLLSQISKLIIKLILALVLVWLFFVAEPDMVSTTLKNYFDINITISDIIVKLFVLFSSILLINPIQILKVFNMGSILDFSKIQTNVNYNDKIAAIDKFTTDLEHVINLAYDKKPLVIFLDDLDRCLPEKALEVLETTKKFLDSQNLVFVIAIEKNVIDKAILSKYEWSAVNDSREEAAYKRVDFCELYLDKLIQLPFTLPSITEQAMENYVNKIVNDNNSEYHKLLAKGLPKNPRKVKRSIERINILKKVANEKFGDDNIQISLIAKILCIEYQYPEIYDYFMEEDVVLAYLDMTINDKEIDSVKNSQKERINLLLKEKDLLGDILKIHVNDEDSFTLENINSYSKLFKTVVDNQQQQIIKNINETGIENLKDYTINYYKVKDISFSSELENIVYIEPTFIDRASEITVKFEDIEEIPLRCVLVGPAGIGKTAFSKRLIQKYYEKHKGLSTKESMILTLPIYITYRNLNYDNGSLLELLVNVVNYEEHINIDIGMFKELLSRGKVLIIFDGYDEIDPADRKSLFDDILELSVNYPLNRIVITTRDLPEYKYNNFTSFQVYEFKMIDNHDITKYIKTTQFNKFVRDQILEFISALPGGITPALLKIIINSIDRYKSIPKNELDAIEIYIDNLLESQRLKKITFNELTNYDIKVRLSKIALIMKKKDIEYFGKEDLIEIIEEKSSIEDFINYLIYDLNLIIENDYQKYEFKHKSIFDYFINFKNHW